MWMEGNRISDRDRDEIKVLVRKYRSIFKRYSAQTEVFPNIEEFAGEKNLFFKLPPEMAFLDAEGIPPALRRMCVQDVIDRARFLTDIRPASVSQIRSIAEIGFPKLSNSGIILCSDFSCVTDLLFGGRNDSTNNDAKGSANDCTNSSANGGANGGANNSTTCSVKRKFISSYRSLEKEWTICVPDSFTLEGVVEEATDNECVYHREFWYVGELD